MSVSGQELLRRVREHIVEVDPTEVLDLLGSPDVAIIDVRETEEVAQGKIRGAVHVPRSYLETRIEGIAPDRSKRVILYCASGNRSAFGAKTLAEDMGYEHVESLTGGITLWKDRGYPVEVPRTLTPEQRQRYSRHLLLPEVGADGQQKLLDAKVLLLGAGGLGSPTALYLAAAGVGTIGIVDDDVVDVTNLQRQVIHTTSRVGVLEGGLRRGGDPRPQPRRQGRQVRDAPRRLQHRRDRRGLGHGRRRRRQLPDPLPAERRDRPHEASPSSPPRSSASRASSASSSRYEGPCYRCLFRQPPPAELAPSCGANGVLGVLPGTMGLLQATEVVKLILGVGDPLIGRLLMYDALGATVTELKVRRDPECPICSRDPERDRRRRARRVPRLRGVLRRGGIGSRASWPRFESPRSCVPSVGGEREVSADGDTVGAVLQNLADAHPETRGPALRRRRRAEPLRQRLPQRRGRPRARRAGDRRRRRRRDRDPARDGRRRLSAMPRHAPRAAAATAARLRGVAGSAGARHPRADRAARRHLVRRRAARARAVRHRRPARRRSPRALGEDAAGRSLQYSTTEGDPLLRERDRRAAHRPRPADRPPDEVLVTSGSQQALTLVATLLLEPGSARARRGARLPRRAAGVQARRRAARAGGLRRRRARPRGARGRGRCASSPCCSTPCRRSRTRPGARCPPIAAPRSRGSPPSTGSGSSRTTPTASCATTARPSPPIAALPRGRRPRARALHAVEDRRARPADRLGARARERAPLARHRQAGRGPAHVDRRSGRERASGSATSTCPRTWSTCAPSIASGATRLSVGWRRRCRPGAPGTCPAAACSSGLGCRMGGMPRSC